MIRSIASRLGLAAGTWFLAVALIFIAVRVLPGNPLIAKFGQHPDPAQMAKLAEEYGWNRPLYQQLADFFWQLGTTGDLGQSIARGHVSVGRELRERIPATIELTLAACCLSVPLGIFAGVIAAVNRGKFPDLVLMAGSLLGVSIPVFFLGMLLRGIFTGLPTSQRLPPQVFDFQPLTGLYLCDTLLRGRVDLWWTAGRHLLLPAVTLSSVPTAIIARLTRSSMLDVLSSDFIRTARAKGASFWRTVWRHALPNAAVPVTNIAGLQIGLLLSGAVLTETVFDWPGLGQYLASAVVRDRDYVAVQAGAVVIAAMFVGLNFVLDLIYLWLDPRLRQA